jgi:adhesin/invasin
MTNRISRFRPSFVALLALVPAAGCAKKDAVEPNPVPAALIVVQGANQAVQAGKELPTPIILRAVAEDGSPMEAIGVAFVIASGGGSVTPGTAMTDASGEVKIRWVLGPAEVSQSLRASVAGLDPVTVNATGIVPSDIVVAQGNNQTAKVNAALPTPIVLRVIGAANTAIVGIPVSLQVASGGGQINPATATTNNSGEITVRWTLGPLAGSQALAVTVGNLQPATVSATATP